MSYLPGKFVWFEHLSSDVAKARAFYEGLFGWSAASMPHDGQTYTMIKNGAEAIGGWRSAPPQMPNQWVSYLSVPDVDASYAAATAAGAKGMMPPTDFPNVGRAAGIVDPTGASLALWKGLQGDPADVKEAAVGSWFWNECWTPDDKKALAFYEKVFGYEHDAMDMGGHGTYYVLKKDGVARAGIIKSSPQPNGTTPPPMWLPYVKVADCDACAKQAAALGGKAVMPPTDIPNVGRFAVLLDPVGAALAVMKSTMQA